MQTSPQAAHPTTPPCHPRGRRRVAAVLLAMAIIGMTAANGTTAGASSAGAASSPAGAEPAVGASSAAGASSPAGVGAAQPAPATAPLVAIPEPAADPFYAPPAGYEARSPGDILRTRSVTVTALGLPLPVRSTQLLVRSTDARGRPAAVTTTLMVPLTRYAGSRPLLSYQPAIDSLGDQCNPSYTLRRGTERELPLLGMGLLRGWAVVVTDHEGPRNAFGSGPMAGHATLDGVRAALRLPGTGLAGTSTPVGLWGYSGGALATAWAAELHPSYAPELRLRGVAAGGTPADLEAAGRRIDGGPFSGLLLAVAVGLSREHPELVALFDERGRQLVDDIGDLCLDQELARYPFRRLSDLVAADDPFAHPTVQEVLAFNRLGDRAPAAPVHLYHAVADELVPYASAEDLRASWCRAGTPVQLRTDTLGEHVSLAVTGAPSAVSYLAARFAGDPPPSDCPG